ncbi:MAG: hypothetical protein WA947_14680 [Phormidesmis sp.]
MNLPTLSLPTVCAIAPQKNPKFSDRKFGLRWMLVSVLLIASLTSCRSNENSDADNNGDEFISGSSAVLTNTSTNVSITVPDGWIKMGEDLRRSHDIYAIQPSSQLHATVLSEDESGLRQFGLADNSTQYRQLIRDELDRFESETKTDVTRIDGHKALQYEIRGTVDSQPVVYLHTTVEGTDGYYQVVGWTTADRYRESKDVLETVVESFEGA